MLLLFMFSDGSLLSIFWKHVKTLVRMVTPLENSSVMGVVSGEENLKSHNGGRREFRVAASTMDFVHDGTVSAF